MVRTITQAGVSNVTITSADLSLQIKDVLIVDDSKTMRSFISNTLGSYKDFNVIEAEDGLEAITILKSHHVKLVIVDYNMPRMNGIEFIKQMRVLQQYKTTPIIMLTSESEESKVRQGYVAGATVYVTKPFNPDNLLKIVEAMRYWHIK